MLALPGTSAIDEYVPMRGYFDVGDGPAPVVIGDRAASLAKLALIMCAVITVRIATATVAGLLAHNGSVNDNLAETFMPYIDIESDTENYSHSRSLVVYRPLQPPAVADASLGREADAHAAAVDEPAGKVSTDPGTSRLPMCPARNPFVEAFTAWEHHPEPVPLEMSANHGEDDGGNDVPVDNDVPVSAALEYGNVTGVTRSLENMEIQEVLVDDDPQETWHIEAAETSAANASLTDGERWRVSASAGSRKTFSVAPQGPFALFILGIGLAVFLGVTARVRHERRCSKRRTRRGRTRKTNKRNVTGSPALPSEDRQSGHASTTSCDETPVVALTNTSAVFRPFRPPIVNPSTVTTDAKIAACVSQLERAERMYSAKDVLVRTLDGSLMNIKGHAGVGAVNQEAVSTSGQPSLNLLARTIRNLLDRIEGWRDELNGMKGPSERQYGCGRPRDDSRSADTIGLSDDDKLESILTMMCAVLKLAVTVAAFVPADQTAPSPAGLAAADVISPDTDDDADDRRASTDATHSNANPLPAISAPFSGVCGQGVDVREVKKIRTKYEVRRHASLDDSPLSTVRSAHAAAKLDGPFRSIHSAPLSAKGVARTDLSTTDTDVAKARDQRSAPVGASTSDVAGASKAFSNGAVNEGQPGENTGATSTAFAGGVHGSGWGEDPEASGADSGAWTTATPSRRKKRHHRGRRAAQPTGAGQAAAADVVVPRQSTEAAPPVGGERRSRRRGKGVARGTM